MTPAPCRAVRSRLVGDVALDEVGDRQLEEHLDRLGVAGEQGLEPLAVGRVADPGVGRRVEGPQPVPDPVVGVLVGEEAVHVGRRQRPAPTRPCGAGSSQSANDVPSRKGRPLAGIGRVDTVAPAGQAELVDHQRVQQADQVGAGADQVAGVGERAARGCRHRPAGRGPRGPAPSGRPGPGRRPRPGRCGRRRPRRRPSAGRPARRPAPAGRPGRARPRPKPRSHVERLVVVSAPRRRTSVQPVALVDVGRPLQEVARLTPCEVVARVHA